MNLPPGWVDLQVNGHGGVDFSSAGLTADGFLKAVDGVLSSGTAIFLPTLITSPMEVYRRNLVLIKNAIIHAGLERHIPGIHLEGPFLSTRAIGCHNPAWTQPCEIEKLESILDITPGFVRIITVAADLAGVGGIIRYAKEKGVTVSLGHHLANVADLSEAAQAGATALTHLGNGLPDLLNRHSNPIWAGLSEDSLTAMIITDGHHLPLEVVKCILRVKGVDHTIVVSDAASAAGLPPGRYQILGNEAILEPGGRLYSPEKNCLVGSSSTLSMCMNWLQSTGFVTKEDLQKLGRSNPLKLIRLQN